MPNNGIMLATASGPASRSRSKLNKKIEFPGALSSTDAESATSVAEVGKMSP